MSVDSQIVGKWNLESSDNFDGYMKEAGVSLMTRTIASKLKPVLEFAIEGDTWTMTSTSTFKTHVVKFKLGQEFDDKTADGRDVLSTFSVDGNKLIQVEKAKSGKDSRIERFVENGKLIINLSCGDVKSQRIYVKS